MKINLLSLFNGFSGAHLSFDCAGIEVGSVYYSEIDKYANKVTEKHYPNDIALGDVTKWKEWDIDWSSIDFVTAGFPCQAWSIAGKQFGDKDERGMLFWTTLEIIAHVLKHNPSAKFLMENVKMKKDFEEYITHHTSEALGYVEKTLINSALVSAQNRQRYYWTNFEVTQPEDKGILLKDIIENEPDVKYTVNQDVLPRYTDENGKVKGFRDENQKSKCLTASMHKGFGNDGCTVVSCGARDSVVVYNTADNQRIKGITEDERGFRPHKGDKAKSGISECGRILKESAGKTDTVSSAHAPKLKIGENNGILYRKLTPLECERLQTVPDNFTDCVSNTQRYKMLGNGWTIDVIAHILKCAYEVD